MPGSASRPYSFGIQGGPFDAPNELGDHARRIEELGYSELFTSDHIGAPGGGGRTGGMYVVDPFAPLLIAAAATTRLRVGTLVLNNEFYNPALLARTAATVDRLSSGRLVLGLGTGYAEAEHDAIGVPIRAPGPRVTRFGESLGILRSILDSGSVEYRGEHEYAVFDDVGFRPEQAHVPFLIGGHGRRVVTLAAKYGDVFQFTGLTHGEGGVPTGGGFALADLIERARWLDDAAGARGDEIERSALVQFVAVGDDTPSDDELAEQFELPPAVIRETPFVLSGTVEHIVEKIRRLREQLSITHYVVRDAEAFAPVVAALTSSMDD